MIGSMSIIPVAVQHLQQGLLEAISGEVDVPYFVIELNFHGKDKGEQRRVIRKIEHIIANTEYKVNGEFSEGRLRDNIYHLHFRRMEPNA